MKSVPFEREKRVRCLEVCAKNTTFCYKKKKKLDSVSSNSLPPFLSLSCARHLRPPLSHLRFIEQQKCQSIL